VRVVSLVTCFGELFAEFTNLAFITPNQNNLPLLPERLDLVQHRQEFLNHKTSI
jgi:hypothetical protein